MKNNIYKSKKLTLQESRSHAKTESGLLFEDIVNLKKKPRQAKEAKAKARSAVIAGFNPYEVLVKQHKEAVKAVSKALKNEFKKTKTEENKITVTTNFIKNG
jgi:hypothetical protein